MVLITTDQVLVYTPGGDRHKGVYMLPKDAILNSQGIGFEPTTCCSLVPSLGLTLMRIPLNDQRPLKLNSHWMHHDASGHDAALIRSASLDAWRTHQNNKESGKTGFQNSQNLQYQHEEAFNVVSTQI